MADLIHDELRDACLPAAATGRPLSRLTAAIARTVLAWGGRRRARRGLARLDAHMLRDIGLSEHHVRNECDKPFWRD